MQQARSLYYGSPEAVGSLLDKSCNETEDDVINDDSVVVPYTIELEQNDQAMLRAKETLIKKIENEGNCKSNKIKSSINGDSVNESFIQYDENKENDFNIGNILPSKGDEKEQNLQMLYVQWSNLKEEFKKFSLEYSPELSKAGNKEFSKVHDDYSEIQMLNESCFSKSQKNYPRSAETRTFELIEKSMVSHKSEKEATPVLRRSRTDLIGGPSSNDLILKNERSMDLSFNSHNSGSQEERSHSLHINLSVGNSIAENAQQVKSARDSTKNEGDNFQTGTFGKKSDRISKGKVNSFLKNCYMPIKTSCEPRKNFISISRANEKNEKKTLQKAKIRPSLPKDESVSCIGNPYKFSNKISDKIPNLLKKDELGLNTFVTFSEIYRTLIQEIIKTENTKTKGLEKLALREKEKLMIFSPEYISIQKESMTKRIDSLQEIIASSAKEIVSYREIINKNKSALEGLYSFHENWSAYNRAMEEMFASEQKELLDWQGSVRRSIQNNAKAALEAMMEKTKITMGKARTQIRLKDSKIQELEATINRIHEVVQVFISKFALQFSEISNKYRDLPCLKKYQLRESGKPASSSTTIVNELNIALNDISDIQKLMISESDDKLKGTELRIIENLDTQRKLYNDRITEMEANIKILKDINSGLREESHILKEKLSLKENEKQQSNLIIARLQSNLSEISEMLSFEHNPLADITRGVKNLGEEFRQNKFNLIKERLTNILQEKECLGREINECRDKFLEKESERKLLKSNLREAEVHINDLKKAYEDKITIILQEKTSLSEKCEEVIKNQIRTQTTLEETLGREEGLKSKFEELLAVKEKISAKCQGFNLNDQYRRGNQRYSDDLKEGNRETAEECVQSPSHLDPWPTELFEKNSSLQCLDDHVNITMTEIKNKVKGKMGAILNSLKGVVAQSQGILRSGLSFGEENIIEFPKDETLSSYFKCTFRDIDRELRVIKALLINKISKDREFIFDLVKAEFRDKAIISQVVGPLSDMNEQKDLRIIIESLEKCQCLIIEQLKEKKSEVQAMSQIHINKFTEYRSIFSKISPSLKIDAEATELESLFVSPYVTITAIDRNIKKEFQLSENQFIKDFQHIFQRFKSQKVSIAEKTCCGMMMDDITRVSLSRMEKEISVINKSFRLMNMFLVSEEVIKVSKKEKLAEVIKTCNNFIQDTLKREADKLTKLSELFDICLSIQKDDSHLSFKSINKIIDKVLNNEHIEHMDKPKRPCNLIKSVIDMIDMIGTYQIMINEFFVLLMD